ncbi:MAG: SIMPL domain-containing protein [Anaerolineae bacterium]|nr:SIMPL domain-containing protein [Anaerolineae bacterium]
MFAKKLMLAAAALMLLSIPVFGSAALSGESAAAQEPSAGERSITVTGYGVSYGSPDIARVGLGVESSNADVQVALEETNTRLDAVLAALREAGVADADIQTNYFSIYQDYYGGSPEGRGEPTYRVSSSVNVRVRDTAQVGVLIASAVDAGANIVSFVEFNIADRAALESDARALAITDARTRADEIAAALGLTVGEPLRVVEGADAGFLGENYGRGGAGGASASPIEQGVLSVHMAITITYAAQ